MISVLCKIDKNRLLVDLKSMLVFNIYNYFLSTFGANYHHFLQVSTSLSYKYFHVHFI
jgi:hypothetical protein